MLPSEFYCDNYNLQSERIGRNLRNKINLSIFEGLNDVVLDF